MFNQKWTLFIVAFNANSFSISNENCHYRICILTACGLYNNDDDYGNIVLDK